jgi:Na+/proline symporter
MVYLGIWIRRSRVMTGAEWIRTRFGEGQGALLSRLMVAIFAIIATIGFMAYDFKGIGKFCEVLLPWKLSANTYALLFMSITAFYVIVGGMYSVVITDLIQYAIMVVVSAIIAGLAISKTGRADILEKVPTGWTNLFPTWSELCAGWPLNLDWSNFIPSVNQKIADDGWELFGLFFMVVLFKGILASSAGPPPNKDLQRMLATRSPKDCAMMCMCTQAVLYVPRYLLIAGITVLGLVFYSEPLRQMGGTFDTEQVLPYVVNKFLPVGVIGLVLAGMLAAFMSTFSGTINNGASYIVNDLYRRYINPKATDRKYIAASYVSSIAVVAVGIIFGYMTKSIHEVTQWIVAGLYAGQLAPNILKWYWWRFNAYGYFSGMLTGITAALAVPKIFPEFNTMLHVFPIVLVISMAASVVVSLLTRPDEQEVLKDFYRRVRPWGFWGPVLRAVQQEDPAFRRNTDFARDMVNVAAGIVWQTALTLIPIYLVIRGYRELALCGVVLAASSVFLKYNWYDRLEKA